MKTIKKQKLNATIKRFLKGTNLKGITYNINSKDNEIITIVIELSKNKEIRICYHFKNKINDIGLFQNEYTNFYYFHNNEIVKV